MRRLLLLLPVVLCLLFASSASALDRYELAHAGEQRFESLSGGQQARFQILLLELSGATLLLLDEPTDNLDLHSAEALETGLAAFEGTVLAVTHDRWFARGFDRFLVFGAVLADLLPLKDPTETFRGVARTGPSADHWFGADNIGHDVFSRAIYGARRSLFIATVATLVGLVAAATTRIGPTVITISATHGAHLGDLLAFAVSYIAALVITVALLRGR